VSRAYRYHGISTLGPGAHRSPQPLGKRSPRPSMARGRERLRRRGGRLSGPVV